MKRKILLLALIVFLFSSCIVKSIQPFYTMSSINYSKNLVGKWTDNKKGQWNFESFNVKWKAENKKLKLSEEDKAIYQRYKDGYYLTYSKKDTEASFIAMPFKVSNHLFIDLTPFEYDSDDLNNLAAQHLLKTHSAALVEMNDGNITFKWLSDKAISTLISQSRLRIKHEKTGIDDDLVLTANSEELLAFLKKFMTMDFEEKWDREDIRRLKPSHAKP